MYCAFYNTSVNLAIYVPEDMEEQFKTEYWPLYAAFINPDESRIHYPLSLNGESFSDDHLTITCGDGTASYDPQNKTLTLENAVITTHAPAYFDTLEASRPAIASSIDDLSLVLVGDNTLLGDSLDGLESNGSLSISGTGSLYMSETPDTRRPKSLYVKSTFSLEGAELIAEEAAALRSQIPRFVPTAWIFAIRRV